MAANAKRNQPVAPHKAFQVILGAYLRKSSTSRDRRAMAYRRSQDARYNGQSFHEHGASVSVFKAALSLSLKNNKYDRSYTLDVVTTGQEPWSGGSNHDE